MKKTATFLTAVIVFMVVTIFAGCSDNRINLSAKDYLDVSTNGFNGNAIVSLSVDTSKLDELKSEIFKDFDYTNPDQYKKYGEFESGLYDLKSSMSYEIVSDKKKDFSNGDVISVKLKYNEEKAGKINVAFSDTTFDYTVEGLTVGTTIDPFKGLKVEYNGIAPNISATFDTTNCEDYVRNNVEFMVDSDNGELSNGEKFNVSISYSESKAEENAIMFSQTSKQFTVEGAPEYPKNLDGVDLTAVDAQFKDMLDGNALTRFVVGSEINVFGSWSDNFKVSKVTSKPVSKVYLMSKNTSDRYNNTTNRYQVIWQIDAQGTFTRDYDNYKKGQKATVSAYYVTYISNIPVDSNKKISDEYLTNYGDEYYSTGDKKSYNEVYSTWVTANKANYNIVEMPVE